MCIKHPKWLLFLFLLSSLVYSLTHNCLTDAYASTIFREGSNISKCRKNHLKTHITRIPNSECCYNHLIQHSKHIVNQVLIFFITVKWNGLTAPNSFRWTGLFCEMHYEMVICWSFPETENTLKGEHSDRYISKCLDIWNAFWYNRLLDSLTSRSSEMDKIVSGIWCLLQFDLGGSSRTKRMPPKNLGTILLTWGSRKNSFFFNTSSLLVSHLKSCDGWQDRQPFQSWVHPLNKHILRAYSVRQSNAQNTALKMDMLPPGETQ